MNCEDNYNIASRYRTVRKRLDDLGYKHALSLDALPLIERLLVDLIQTTDSLKHFKAIAQDNIEACSQLQSTVDPYKCDNARLTKECNQLHLEVIESKEAHEKQVKELKKQIYKLESECNDLQLASSYNLQKIKDLEAESAKKSKKILELQGKCLKPIISNVALAAKKRSCYPLRRPVLECDPLPAKAAASLPNLSTVEPKVVDLLSMADHKLSCLTNEVTQLKAELSLQIDNVQMLKSQAATKEKEIIRLRKMLEGGRPYSAVTKDCSCKKSDRGIIQSHDNIDYEQLRISQQEKLELEQQLKEALNKQHDAMSQAMKLAERNEELEKELRDIDHIALAVEADCNTAVKENNKRVCRLQEKLEDAMTQVHVLESELILEHRKVQELRADLEACRLEKRNIQRTLDTTLDEKKQMTDKINQLTMIEKRLSDDIVRLSNENESQKEDIVRLQYTNNLLNERINSKESAQCDNGNNSKQSKEKAEKNVCTSKAKITLKKKSGQCERKAKGSDHLKDVNNFVNDVHKEILEKDSQLTALKKTIERLENERDHYRAECNHFREQYAKGCDKDNAELWTKTCELRQQLAAREQALAETQRERNELHREKVNLEARLQSLKNQQTRCVSGRSCNLCKPINSCMCSPSSHQIGSDSGATKETFQRLEREKDLARADVERLIEERDALRERLKVATEAHTTESRRAKEDYSDLESRFKHIERERQELLAAQGTRRATISGLEGQLEDAREELKKTKQELTTQRTQYFQLRALQDQTDQALGDVQGQLAQSEAEMSKALDRNRSMEQKHIQLEKHVKELKQEINVLRSNMTHLDKEKDQLLLALDEKTERIVGLERELMMKDQQAIALEQQIREIRHKNEICIDQSADQERQLRTMQLEMENVQRQLESTAGDRENAIQENRRLQDDLAAVTCECRTLQRELEVSRAESYDLKKQLQTYVSEVRRAEELLTQKENERTDMLNHFRCLSLEATVLENNNHSLESEAAEVKGALKSARDHLMDLERQLADKECLIRGYETKISELSQNMACLENQLHQESERRERAENEVKAIRDLCTKLDEQKDMCMQKLGDQDSIKSHYESQLTRLKSEHNAMGDQLEREHAAVKRLECLLEQAKRDSLNAQTNNQELQNEISRLRTKLSELRCKLSNEETELRQCQSQAAEYSRQITELRRQVTNERFDRVRIEEENRSKCQAMTSMFQQTTSTDNPAYTPELPPYISQTLPTETKSNGWQATATNSRSLNSTPDSVNVDLNVKEEIPDSVGVAFCKCFRENGVYYANITFRSDDVQEVKNKVQEGRTTKTFKLECKKHKLFRRRSKSGTGRAKSPQTDKTNSTKKETFTPLATSSPYDILGAKQSETTQKTDNSTKKSYIGKKGKEKVIQKNKTEESKKIEECLKDCCKVPSSTPKSINQSSGKSSKFQSILPSLTVKRKGIDSPDLAAKRKTKPVATQSSTTEVTIGTSATSLDFQEENHSSAPLMYPNKYNSQQFSYSSKGSQPKKTRFTSELELSSENRSRFNTAPQSLNIHTQTCASGEGMSDIKADKNVCVRENDYLTGGGKLKDCFNVANSVHIPDSPVVPQVSVVLNDVQDFCGPENANGDTTRGIQVTVNLNSTPSDEKC